MFLAGDKKFEKYKNMGSGFGVCACGNETPTLFRGLHLHFGNNDSLS